jgi:pimeloyl-ACP methyl ester carboxylesterase
MTLPNVPLPTLGGKQLWADRYVFAGWRVQESVVTGHCRLLAPNNVRWAWGRYDQCRAAFDGLRAERRIAQKGTHLVLLLHGIFRAKEAFRPMEKALRAAGYEAVSVNYPSTRRPLEAHAAQIAGLLDDAEGVDTVSFVGHSMGGLVSRIVTAREGAWRRRIRVNRLVTIGTPHRGAELADQLGALETFHAIAGPSAAQLGASAAPEIPLPGCPFGVVAGARGDGKGWNPLVPGDDDGTVALSSALLDGAEDTLVVPGVHTFLMRRPDVVEAVVRYLATGRF